MARPRTGRAQAEQEGSGPSGGGQVLPGTMVPCVALCVEIVRGPGEPGTESRATCAQAVRATKRPTIPAPSHLLDKVVKRHHSSTNVVTLELSNLFVVNEHTDGANTALMNHKISSLTILTLVRAKRHRPRKEHSDSYASSMS